MRRLAAVLLVCVLLAGCSDGAERSSAPAPDRAGSAAAGPETGPETVQEHCELVTHVDSDAPVSELSGEGMSLPVADFVAPRPSGTVVVLLHQTGAYGLCGWATFAGQAADAGFSSVAFDLCGYGAATCEQGEATPPEAQVALAVAHARADLGAQRVGLVGASMGGSQTVIAVARGAAVDAWADLSGPDAWEGVALAPLTDAVAARGLPALMMRGPDDSTKLFRASRRLAAATGAQFVGDGADHGWAMLDDHTGTLRPAGQQLLDFLASV